MLLATVAGVITPRRPPLLPAAVLALLLGGCATAGGPAAAVPDEEARAAVADVVALAAQRTPEAMEQLCARNDGCPGMSGGAERSPQDAPGPDRPPRELCVVAVPPTPAQAGSRIVVLEGVDGRGRPYVTQVLVDRDHGSDRPEVQEPAFWIGIRYTALQHGRAWSGTAEGPGQPEEDNEKTRRACTDTAAWIAEVATRTTDRDAAPPGA